ncbi:hypothetical protein HID58_004034 [Brassica napus]|uniref:Uncharacterized protein n=1 Tax=Brassica napus TaxID=3708 RepID=A0ABQ7XI34_BRANA|nr:hypothetical protein HID58_004034 [Brassica napus]
MKTRVKVLPLEFSTGLTMFCNGRKLGFAVRRSANKERRVMLKKLELMTLGAGVLPSGFGVGAGTTVRAQNMAIDYDSPAKQSILMLFRETTNCRRTSKLL